MEIHGPLLGAPLTCSPSHLSLPSQWASLPGPFTCLHLHFIFQLSSYLHCLPLYPFLSIFMPVLLTSSLFLWQLQLFSLSLLLLALVPKHSLFPSCLHFFLFSAAFILPIPVSPLTYNSSEKPREYETPKSQSHRKIGSRKCVSISVVEWYGASSKSDGKWHWLVDHLN